MHWSTRPLEAVEAMGILDNGWFRRPGWISGQNVCESGKRYCYCCIIHLYIVIEHVFTYFIYIFTQIQTHMLLKCNTHCFLKIKAVAFHFPASFSLPARMSCVVRFAYAALGKNLGICTATNGKGSTQWLSKRQDANPNFRNEVSNYHNSWHQDLRKPEGIASQLKDGGIAGDWIHQYSGSVVERFFEFLGHQEKFKGNDRPLVHQCTFN